MATEAAPVTADADEKATRVRRRGRVREEASKINWWLTALMVVLSLTVLIPLYFAVVTSLKTPEEFVGAGFDLPSQPQWSNYAEAWRLTNYPRVALNSAIITVGAVSLTLLTNSMVAYAISRNLDRRFFKGLYFYFISALFVPFPIIMLPVVKQTSLLNMDNHVGLILLYVVYGLASTYWYTSAISAQCRVSWRRRRPSTVRRCGAHSGRSCSPCLRR